MSLADRARLINGTTPHLVADVTLYKTDEGGRQLAALPGWGCPCMIDANSKIAWDAWPVLGDTPLLPGEKRRLGFVFLSDEAPEKMKAAGQFFLWEGKVIGEAVVADSNVLGTVFEA